MTRNFRTLLFLSLILGACSRGVSSPEASPANPATAAPSFTIPPALPSDIPTTPTTEVIPVWTAEILPAPKLITTLTTPHIDQGPDGPQGCGYQWAYKDMPELSSAFQQSIQRLQPAAQASAFGFGEDCVYADGTSTFIPMETDFNITLQINDLSNESDLGKWIVTVMQVVQSIPAEQIIGPRPGRVMIVFESDGEQKFVSFYIDQYQALPAGLSNAEIFQRFKSP